MNNNHINPEVISNIFYRTFRNLTFTTSQLAGAETFSNFCARSSPGLSRLQRDKDLVVSPGGEQPTLTSHQSVAPHDANCSGSPQDIYSYLEIDDVSAERKEL